MLKYWFICGGLFGFLAVAFEAFGANALSKRLSSDMTNEFELAIRYQMYHALALLVVALLQLHTGMKEFEIAGWAFIVGTLLFSGSVYMHAITGFRWLKGLIPMGGIVLLIGWGYLLFQSIKIVQ